MTKKKCIIICLVTSLILIAAGVTACYITSKQFYKKGYNEGYNDHIYYAEDGTPIVYITKSGNKYHNEYCFHLENGISVDISLARAEKLGYTRCQKCDPPQ